MWPNYPRESRQRAWRSELFVQTRSLALSQDPPWVGATLAHRVICNAGREFWLLSPPWRHHPWLFTCDCIFSSAETLDFSTCCAVLPAESEAHRPGRSGVAGVEPASHLNCGRNDMDNSTRHRRGLTDASDSRLDAGPASGAGRR